LGPHIGFPAYNCSIDTTGGWRSSLTIRARHEEVIVGVVVRASSSFSTTLDDRTK
jgi:hypothetical protein